MKIEIYFFKIKLFLVRLLYYEKPLRAAFFNLVYGERSISSSYEKYHRSCNYSNEFIYLLGNIKLLYYFFYQNLIFINIKFFKYDQKVFRPWITALSQ